MNRIRLTTLLVLSLTVCFAAAQETPDSVFRTQRLSERVLLLTEISPMENIIVALAGRDGLAVVDTTGSPHTAKLLRQIIAREFGRDDFAWVINTHYHWDHAFGNQAFPEAVLVGHENCRPEWARQAEQASRMAENARRRLERAEAEESVAREPTGQSPPPPPPPRGQREFDQRIYDGLSSGLTPHGQSVTFRDRMVLDLGDLTVKLTWFGRAHSTADIFIQVPEEKLLLTGDLFLERGWLPLFSGQSVLDVPRWLEVLDDALDGVDPVEHVIPGHRDIWTPEKLARWRDYIRRLWRAVSAAHENKTPLDTLFTTVPLGAEFDYLLDIHHTREELDQFHRRNLESFYRQFQQSAAVLFEEILNREGLAAAREKFAVWQKKPTEYYVNERQFNALGYRLLGRGQTDDAVAVFTLNTALFPGSWNAWDSLAEAYMTAGHRAKAIEYYRKSLELNPQNGNATQRLRELEAPE